jgi:hypothetical protein
MQDSEDVEMMLGWWNRDKDRVRGHYVTITGTAVINGQKQFRYKEDDNQAEAGGTHMPSVFWRTDESGASLVSDFSDRNAVCFIEGIVSESYDTTVKFIESGIEDLLKGRHTLLRLEKNPSLRSEFIAMDLFVAKPSRYTLIIVDLAGREVARIADQYLDFGTKRYYWDGNFTSGIAAPSGMYYAVVSGGGTSEAFKIVRY